MQIHAQCGVVGIRGPRDPSPRRPVKCRLRQHVLHAHLEAIYMMNGFPHCGLVVQRDIQGFGNIMCVGKEIVPTPSASGRSPPAQRPFRRRRRGRRPRHLRLRAVTAKKHEPTTKPSSEQEQHFWFTLHTSVCIFSGIGKHVCYRRICSVVYFLVAYETLNCPTNGRRLKSQPQRAR